MSPLGNVKRTFPAAVRGSLKGVQAKQAPASTAGGAFQGDSFQQNAFQVGIVYPDNPLERPGPPTAHLLRDTPHVARG